VRVLSKASIVVGVTALVLFAIWLVERNADARASNGLVALALCVVAASALVLYQRRLLYFERPAPPRRSPVVATPVARVTIVAVRSLSYDWLVTAAGEETTPHLQELRETSYLARMTPFNSSSARALWASLATGKLPNRHGVTGRYSYRTLLNRDDAWLNIPVGVAFPSWGLIPPVEKIAATLPSGASLPAWTMVQQSGAQTVVAGWPASRGSLAGGVRGSSDPLCRGGAAAMPGDEAALRAACISAAEVSRAVRARLSGLDSRVIERIGAAAVSDRAATTLAIGLAGETSAPLTIISLNQVEETARAIGHAGNALPAATTAEGRALRLALEQTDALIRDIDRSIDDDVLLVVSPSGCEPPTIPSSPMSALSLMTAKLLYPGADEGFLLVAAGGGAPPNPDPVQVVDLVPTVLYATGMPIARDLDGRVLTEALGEAIVGGRSAVYIQTYELGPRATR
jgi:hypothetical protein